MRSGRVGLRALITGKTAEQRTDARLYSAQNHSRREPAQPCDVSVTSRHERNRFVDPQQDMYFRQAQHCRKMADFCKSLDLKAAWLELAARWLTMIGSQSNIVQGQFGPAEHDDGEDRKRA